MRSWSLAAVFLVGLAGCGSVVDLVADGGKADGGSSDGSTDLSASKLGNGDSCMHATDCGSGICVDGVCCNTECDGICEACNLPGAANGTCTAIAANTDPANECMVQPLPDGGVGDAGADGGEQLNLPDGGLNGIAGPCAPTCNGQRACGFPSETQSCGDTFCNTSVEEGEAVCDGQGHCGVTTRSCQGYACEGKACETACATDSDCDATFYCDGAHCQPKKQIGITCDNNPDECATGYCSNNVCCNSDCASIPGGVCNASGSVGTCKCQVNSMDCNGACELYYNDTDGDGYGSTVDTGIVGCTGDMNNPPPPGRVAASSANPRNDCDDGHNTIHPGSGFSSTATWPSSVHSPAFDWDCDGTVEREYPTSTTGCAFCAPSSSNVLTAPGCGGSQATCTANNFQAYLSCSSSEHPTGYRFGFNCCGHGCAEKITSGDSLGTIGYVNNSPACGGSATATLCGTCDKAGDPIGTGTNNLTFSQVQSCR